MNILWNIYNSASQEVYLGRVEKIGEERYCLDFEESMLVEGIVGDMQDIIRVLGENLTHYYIKNMVNKGGQKTAGGYELCDWLNVPNK